MCSNGFKNVKKKIKREKKKKRENEKRKKKRLADSGDEVLTLLRIVFLF